MPDAVYKDDWGVCEECREVLIVHGDPAFRGEHKPECPLKAAEELIHRMAADPNTVIDMEGLDRKGKCSDCGCSWISREDNPTCPDCGSSNVEERREP